MLGGVGALAGEVGRDFGSMGMEEQRAPDIPELDVDPAKEFRDEWMFMDAMKGDVFIEYIYIFKDNRWHVSTQKMYKTKDGYDRGHFFYYTKFEPVIMNKEYIKYKDKHEKHAEVKMISQIGNLLSKAGFDQDNVEIQGGKAKKAN